MRTRRSIATFALAAVVALAGCSDGGSSLSGPGTDGQATVTGRVADGGSGSSVVSTSVRTQQVAGSAETAAVARVRSDGTLETLAEADVAADGQFRIEGVPAGESRLVVVARDSEGGEVGRVIVQGTTRAGATLTVAPITPETSVEGRTYAEVQADGSGQGDENSGGLALFIRMGQQVATGTTGAEARIRTLADAFVEAEAAMTEVFARTGSSMDGPARAEVLTALAARFAADRDQGTSMSAAHRSFVEASLDSLHAEGATWGQLVMATAGQATVAGDVTSSTDSEVRLDVAEHLAQLNLAARTHAAEAVEASSSGLTAASAAAAARAMADARADVQASASIDELRSRTRAASDSAQAAITAEVMDAAAALDLTTRTELESRLETAFAEADLAARLEGRTSASGVAQAVADHRSQVRAAADAIVDLLPSEVALDAEAATSLLIASRGGASLR